MNTLPTPDQLMRDIVRLELAAIGGADQLRKVGLVAIVETVSIAYARACVELYPYNRKLLPPPDWKNIIIRQSGQLGNPLKQGRKGQPPSLIRDSFIYHVMSRLCHPPYGGPPPKIRPTARIVAEVLTEAGIKITGLRVERIYRAGEPGKVLDLAFSRTA